MIDHQGIAMIHHSNAAALACAATNLASGGASNNMPQVPQELNLAATGALPLPVPNVAHRIVKATCQASSSDLRAQCLVLC